MPSNATLCEVENSTSATQCWHSNGSDVVEYYTTRVKYTCDLVNAAILILVMPVILAGNILVVLAVMRFKKLRTSMNLFIASLAVADILVGCPSIPLYVLFFVKGNVYNKYKYLCLSRFSSVVASMSGSIISLTFVSLDRYIAVIHPLHYPILMTKRRVKFMLCGIWTYDVVCSSLPLLGVNIWKEDMPCLFFVVLPQPYTMFTVPFVLAICLILSIGMYIAVFRVAKQHKVRMKRVNINSARRQAVHKPRMEKETRTAKVMAFVLLLFIVFWFPFLLTSVMKFLPISEEMIEIVKTFCVTLAMTNSAMNPIIYCWLRQDFRKAFRIMVCCNKRELKRNVRSFNISLSLCSSDTSRSIESIF